MRVDGVVLVWAIGLTACTVHCYQPKQGAQNIPPRCRQASVTPVSCRQHTPDNLLPHPDDCELFYYCVSPDAQPVCRQCPAGLHFSPRLHVCDHPQVAGCGSVPPSTAVDSTATATTGEGAVTETVTADDYFATGTTTTPDGWWWG